MTSLVGIVGKEKVHCGYNWILTFSGIGYLVFIPLFGCLNDYTGSYSETFLACGSLEKIGGFLLLSIPVYLLCKRCGYEPKINE